ncbi:Response regulator consisting of a CheY-like receiver domain and a winged-helix DNA-binding domain [Hahella chejuensis KCTC 2396]|uniref:Response regulator consisting of a CheY-like receiver domain and a winged-helix DNA-binding domain n=1 Tax=Hahella chejuensis (strain KCTC 2396) TaxID=349521 RepID=Q2SM27_HAHCH|nr:response regulator transcription factor [Hahella chejuensis]ABC28297.1 Response regulator consisting of a CheY-like receiver domain and a winged-helix DNA-binding domain [Hahella chejuensis KCTC 2396]
MNLLLIDDDNDLARLLNRYFQRFGWELRHASAPSIAYAQLKQSQPDAIILDVMLPEEDGFSVCRKLRHDYTTPIIMLTARGEVTDRIVGLEIGADDYLPKPFEPRELAARIQSITRRHASTEKPVPLMYFRDLEINLTTQEVLVAGRPLTLTTSEFRLLQLFASAPGKVFSRDEIMNSLKGTEVELFSRAIDITVSRLRQKMKTKSKREFIKTVWGAGYRFVGEAL